MKAIYDGEYTPVGNFDDTLDHVLAFFLNCYHIKDWLKNGLEWQDEVDSKLKKDAVEQFIKESEALQICADLCNGNKHFHLDAGPRSGSVPRFHSVHTRIDTSTKVPVKTTSYTFATQRGNVDAYDLAQECLDSWRKFIRESTPKSLGVLAERKRGSAGTKRPRPHRSTISRNDRQ